jgi:hypothetical protein
VSNVESSNLEAHIKLPPVLVSDTVMIMKYHIDTNPVIQNMAANDAFCKFGAYKSVRCNLTMRR